MNPSNCNAGGKLVLVVRDPGATALSFFAFFKAKKVPFMAAVADVSEFVRHPSRHRRGSRLSHARARTNITREKSLSRPRFFSLEKCARVVELAL